MKRGRCVRISIILSVVVVFLFAAQMKVLAATPKIDNVKNLGNGRIKVEFLGKVNYKNVKVTVKDTAGKKYKERNIKKDSKGIRFNIRKYKTGKTYKITISGVKKKGSRKYGKVTGRCCIPAADSPGISQSQAREIAQGFVSIEGVYVDDNYYSAGGGYYEATLLNANKKKELFIIRIDAQTGAVVYFEYQPTSDKTRRILITIEEVLKNNQAMKYIFDGIKKSILP